ncbi:MAG: ABC transporter permease [Candidatus Heimdallarchaeota archaeon]
MLDFAVRLVGKESKHSAQAMMAVAIMIAMITSLFMLVSGVAGELFALTELAGTSSYLTILEEDDDGNPKTYFESKLPTTIIQDINHENLEGMLSQRVKVLQFLYSMNGSGTNNTLTQQCETLIWGMNLSQLLEFRPDATIPVGGVENISNTLIAGQSLGFLLNITQLPFRIQPMELESTTFWITGLIQGARPYDLDLLTSELDFLEFFPEETDSLSLVDIKLRDPQSADETAKEIEATLEERGYHIVVRSQKQSQELMAKTFEDLIEKFRYLETFLLIIVLLRIYHVTSWFVMEHWPEFKTLRSLGMTRNSLRITILQISFIVGNFGIFIGIILGAVLPFTLISMLALFFNETGMYPQIMLMHLLEIIVATNVAIFLGAAIPAWQASRKTISVQ